MKLSIINAVVYIMSFYEKVWNEENKQKKSENFSTFFGMTNLRLQLILYFLYGFYYSKTKQHLFFHDFFAYKISPVSKELEFYNAKVIRSKGENWKYIFKVNDYPEFNFLEYKDDFNFELIDEILLSLKKFSTWSLVDLTHLKNSPLNQTKQSEKIDTKILIEYFENLTLNFEEKQ